MWKSSDFLAITRRAQEYLFFLVADHYWASSLRGKEVTQLFEEVFARDIGQRGALVQSFLNDREKNHQLILDKDWPEGTRSQLMLEQKPMLLVIAEDFRKFDPNKNPYIIITLSDETPEVIKMLRELTQVILSGQDLFDFVHRRSTRTKRTLNRLTRSLQLKPGAFGISIDLMQLFGGQSKD